jgi:predicted TIM-barrel fold metal-dependent hydrolase
MSVAAPADPVVPADAAWDCHVHVFESGAPARAGHYLPPHRPLADIESLAQAHGLQRLVLVQPSVYGADNAVLLRALRAGRGRHRGIAVVDPQVTDAELDALHDAGVCGIRFNLVSPAGQASEGDDIGGCLRQLAPRLRERGWHVQWYARAADLPRVAAWQIESGLCFVLDHLAGLDMASGGTAAAWTAARALAEAGAWVKLSGWYRLGAVAPYDVLQSRIARVADLFGPRLVWGSDWPHTSFESEPAPAYASLLVPVERTLGATRLHSIMREQASRLYLERPS